MKNIVICCDGTGNEVKSGALSNVLELYRRLDQTDPTRQIAYYDSGLGTLASVGAQTKLARFVTRLLGLAFGYGLPTNIKEAYAFLSRHYKPGDRVFLFGFSRGAYTVRALTGMVAMCGLLKPSADNLIDYALKVHRKRGDDRWKIASRFRKYFPRYRSTRNDPLIHFVGVWDTVKSIGLFRRSLTLPYTRNMKSVAHGRHAVSLNEKRSKYRPNLWVPPHGDHVSPLTGLPRFRQVWFAGVHSDVGGGYEDNRLSDISLEWMLREAEAHGLLLGTHNTRTLAPDPSGKIHNPLWPFWWVLGWWKRPLPGDAEVHASVGRRMEEDPAFAKSVRTQLPGNQSEVHTMTEEESVQARARLAAGLDFPDP